MTAQCAMIVNFHAEGHYAQVAAQSATLAVERARSAGISTRLVAALDRVDERTRSIVLESGAPWDDVIDGDFGDLGLVRNHMAQVVDAEILAFLDGDDLVGHEWLTKAVPVIHSSDGNVALQPEFVYYFDAADFVRQSSTPKPTEGVSSFYIRQISSDDPRFSLDLLRFNHLYKSGATMPRELLRRFPYRGVDRARGFGVEDWTWNAETIAAGVHHVVIPETVHLVRVRAGDSLSGDNVRQGLLPNIATVFGSRDSRDRPN